MALLFDIPSLSNACLAFLLPSAAGRPVLCMKIAEVRHISVPPGLPRYRSVQD